MKIAMIALDRVDEVTSLAGELSRQGHQVTVHTRRTEAGKRRTTLPDGVVLDPLSAGPEAALAGPDLVRHLPDLGEALAARWKKDAPDIVHAHDWASGLAALTASRKLADPDAGARPVASSASTGIADLLAGRRIPLLQTYGTLAVRRAQVDPTAQAKMERALGRAAVATTVGCEQDREELVRLGVPRARIAVVPAGIDTAEFTEKGPAAPRNSRSRLLLLDGPNADAALVVRALSRIPDAELVVAGGPMPADLDTDPAAEKLRMLAKEEGVEDRVVLLGRVARKRVPRLIRSADLVLALGAHDPYGTVALEAMACGVPVVARRAAGHIDTVLDEVTGLLVPHRITAVDLARRIRALLADPVRREALGIAAADRARSRHSWERIARETLHVYEKIS